MPKEKTTSSGNASKSEDDWNGSEEASVDSQGDSSEGDWLSQIEENYKMLFEENKKLMEDDSLDQVLSDFQEKLEEAQKAAGEERDALREDLETTWEELQTAVSDLRETEEAA